MKGSGCKECNTSILENDIINLLNENKIEYIYNSYPTFMDGLQLDFWMPSLNIAIECQGEQHYKSVKAWGGDEGLLKRKKLDKLKEEKCKKHGIKIIYVGESSYAEKYGLVSLNNFKKSVLEIIK
jgi:hypothetical protein